MEVPFYLPLVNGNPYIRIIIDSFFSHMVHPIFQRILLVLPSKYTQKQTTFLCFTSSPGSSSHNNLLPGVLNGLLSGFSVCILTLYCIYATKQPYCFWHYYVINTTEIRYCLPLVNLSKSSHFTTVKKKKQQQNFSNGLWTMYNLPCYFCKLVSYHFPCQTFTYSITSLLYFRKCPGLPTWRPWRLPLWGAVFSKRPALLTPLLPSIFLRISLLSFYFPK